MEESKFSHMVDIVLDKDMSARAQMVPQIGIALEASLAVQGQPPTLKQRSFVARASSGVVPAELPVEQASGSPSLF